VNAIKDLTRRAQRKRRGHRDTVKNARKGKANTASEEDAKARGTTKCQTPRIESQIGTVAKVRRAWRFPLSDIEGNSAGYGPCGSTGMWRGISEVEIGTAGAVYIRAGRNDRVPKNVMARDERATRL